MTREQRDAIRERCERGGTYRPYVIELLDEIDRLEAELARVDASDTDKERCNIELYCEVKQLRSELSAAKAERDAAVTELDAMCERCADIWEWPKAGICGMCKVKQCKHRGQPCK